MMVNKDFEYNFDRIYNVLNYTFNNPALLEQAFIRKSAESEYFDSNEELIMIGKQIVDVILSKKKYIYNIEVDVQKLKELLWLPIASFDLLEFVYCSKEEIEETFNNNDVKIEIFYAIFGAIAVDSDWNFKALEKVFDTIYTTNLDLLNKMIKNNYIYDIRRYMKESTFNEYYEKYIIRNNDEYELMLATEGYILKSFNENIFETRYSLCKFMYEYLIDCGFVRQ
jgi:dsRNA-specific ribonuclease